MALKSLAQWANSNKEIKNLVVKPDKLQESVARLSSGSLVADYVLGGGWACGRINEVCGMPGSGKTTLCLSTIKFVQERGQGVIYIDSENALDPDYAKKLGVDFNEDLLLVAQTSREEEVDKLLREALSSYKENNIGLLVIDSATSIVPEAWLDGKRSGSIGERARFWSDTCPIIADLAHKANIPVIIVNQMRNKLDFRGNAKYASTEDLADVTGGQALKYYKSLSLYCQNSSKEKDDKHIDELTGEETKRTVGNKIFMKTLKNKTATPFLQGYGFIRYGKGFDNLSTAVNIFLKKGVVYTKSEGKKEYMAYMSSAGKEVLVEDAKELYVSLKKEPELCQKWLTQLDFNLSGKYFGEKK